MKHVKWLPNLEYNQKFEGGTITYWFCTTCGVTTPHHVTVANKGGSPKRFYVCLNCGNKFHLLALASDRWRKRWKHREVTV